MRRHKRTVPLAAHEPVSDGVKELILQGHKIQAIKLYMLQNGTGLKESKDAVDQIEAKLKSGLQS